ncbi:MAG: efflux RND transporter permease subunit, partial [Deltaproteobacteria bacterium]|nr:efflux RND transporter permease subunit [Deltaproteobacteria bacterium]
MSLSSLSVRRGVTFGMIFLLIFLFGAYSLSRLQLDLYPDMTFPAVLIMTNYTGASPEDVETLVTRPIEEGVATVKGIEKISSQSKQGASIVTVEFGWDKDMDQAETDVRRKMDMVTMLPDDSTAPIILAMDPAMQPIVMMTVSGEYSLAKLKELAENDICEQIERLDGVASCEAMGGQDREIRVSLNPDTLAAFGIGIQSMMTAIGMGNMQEPGGAIDQGARSFNIQTTGKYQRIDDIRNVVVAQRMNGQGKLVPVYLHQVAEVTDTVSEETQSIEVDGRPSVWIVVSKQSGFNTVKAAEATIAEIGKIRQARGDSLRFGILFNQADFINQSIGNLSSTAIAAIGISFLVLLFFLRNLRSALIVSTAIPLSVVATFAVMNQMGMTLNVISMAGLALSVGMLVDNAIVVLDNVFRQRQEGVPIRDAAVLGATEVSTAVTASTLTTVSVFLPILFVPGIAGVLFRDMAVTICFALSVSLFVAVSFIPLSASRLLGLSKKQKAGKLVRKDATFRIEAPYARFLKHVLSHRWIVVVGLLLLIGGTVAVAVTMPTDFMAKNDQSMVAAKIKAPVGSNLEETTRYVREAIEQVKESIPKKDRRLIAAEIGSGSGFSALFSEGIHSATLRVPLVSMSKRTGTQQQYEALLLEHLADIPDLVFSIEQPNPTGGSGDMEVIIKGHDLNELRRVGRELTDILTEMPEMAQVVFSFSDPTPQINVAFERDRMAAMGISTAAVSSEVATFFLGRTAAFFSDGDNEHRIYVRLDKKFRTNVAELERMPVSTPSGQTVLLDSIAEITFGPGPVTISRRNQQRMVTIACSLKDVYRNASGKTERKDLGASIQRVRNRLKKYDWPDDMGAEVGGTAEDFIESFIGLGIALIVSVLLVYMVMASQFESFREPFIILFTVPLALIGVVLIFSFTGNSLDVSALIGVIMLVGIVVNNGIVMVDAANQRRNAGAVTRLEAVVLAAQTRLRPVLMTSFTTICSM